MNQFIGLVRKDWYWVRTEIYVGLGFYAIGMVLLPLIMQRTVAVEYSLHEVIVGLSTILVFIGLFLTPVILIWLLYHDMKHPDLWLHTTAGSGKLLGVKILLSGCMGLGTLLITGLVVSVSYFSADVAYSFNDLITLELGVLIIVLYFLFGSAVHTLFFWVLYQVMRPKVGKFSLPFTLILLILFIVFYTKLNSSQFYETYIGIGEINLSAFKEKTGTFSLEGEAIFHIGDFIFDLIIAIVLFITSTFLFNRKVRC